MRKRKAGKARLGMAGFGMAGTNGKRGSRHNPTQQERDISKQQQVAVTIKPPKIEFAEDEQ